jgi:putative nucleotidyltransferase with HDIG domain
MDNMTVTAETEAAAGGGVPDREALSLAKVIEAEIQAGRVELPVLPEAAMRVREILAQDGSVPEIVAVIEREPGFAAAVLRYANSVAFTGLRAVVDLQQAITRLGMATVEHSILSIAARNAFASSDPKDERLFRVLWDHAITTALAARRLAARVVPPELAFLAGLLHDIGKVVILRCVAGLRNEDARFNLSEAALHEFFDSLHCNVGDAFFNSWNIPEPIRDAVRRHHDIRPLVQEDALVAVVACANRIAAKLGASLQPDPEASVLDLPAASFLRLDDVGVAALLVDVEDDVQRLRAAQ